MIIARLLKLLSVLIGLAAMAMGYLIGDQLGAFTEGAGTMTVSLIWIGGLILAVLLFGLGEAISQQCRTNDLLENLLDRYEKEHDYDNLPPRLNKVEVGKKERIS